MGLLKITFGLMGVLLLGLTTVLTIQRHPPPPKALLLHHELDGVTQFFQQWEALPKLLPLGAPFPREVNVEFIPPDGEYVFFFSANPSIGGSRPTRDLHRLDSRTGKIELIAERIDIWEFNVSNDGKWLYYGEWGEVSPSTTPEWLVNLATAAHRALADFVMVDHAQLVVGDFSPDSAWLYLRFWDSTQAVYRFVRISVQAGTTQELFTADTEFTWGWLPSGDGLYIGLAGRPHILQLDNLALRPLLPESSPVSDEPMGIVGGGFADASLGDLLVLVQGERFFGVRVATGEILWEMTGGIPITFQHGATKRLYLQQNASMTWVDVTNGLIRVINLPYPNLYFHTISRDGDWLYYSEAHPNTSFRTMDVVRVNPATGEKEFLRRDLPNALWYKWSPDGEWMIWGSQQDLFRLHATTGKMERLASGDLNYFPTGWVQPKERDWQPLLLFFAGAGLTMGSIFLGRRRR